jgi:cytochrome P450
VSSDIESDLDQFEIDADSINLSDFELWSQPEEYREAVFRSLRRERPIAFFPEMETEIEGMPTGPGYWSLTRYDDVMASSRNPSVFVSGEGTNIPDFPEIFRDVFGSMINMDAPRHTKMRLIVNRGFTPRMVAGIEQRVHELAREIVDEVAPKGECDFVTEVAAALPLRIICDMMGIPASDYQWIFDQTNKVLGAGDPEYGEDIMTALGGGMELYQYAQELGKDRLANPREDITTALMQAEVEGERLTEQELGSFFVLLVVAGNETTRNAISHGLKALTDHPDQRAALLDDFEGVIPTAVEEIVRWATPVIYFRRTAVQDAEIAGQPIKAGDKVVLWYNSANRDEAAFPDPYRFDVRRTPNEHLGFGGGGPHFCLGAHLARREIRVMYEELFKRLPDIHASGPPAMLRSNFIHGIKHLPAKFSPA